jgi:lysophospholipase L1-like esterase
MLPYEYQLRNHYYKNIFKPQDLLLQTLSNTIRDIKDMSIAFNLSKAEFKKYYLYGDGIHFSQKGHKLIADYVVKQLKNEFSD